MFIKMFINFVFYPQAAVRILVFTSQLVFLTPVLAQRCKNRHNEIWSPRRQSSRLGLGHRLSRDYQSESRFCGG